MSINVLMMKHDDEVKLLHVLLITTNVLIQFLTLKKNKGLEETRPDEMFQPVR